MRMDLRLRLVQQVCSSRLFGRVAWRQLNFATYEKPSRRSHCVPAGSPWLVQSSGPGKLPSPYGYKEFGFGLTDRTRSVRVTTHWPVIGFLLHRPNHGDWYTNVPACVTAGLRSASGTAPAGIVRAFLAPGSIPALHPGTDNRTACGTSRPPANFSLTLTRIVRRSSEAASPDIPGKAEIGGGHETPGSVETVGSAGARADRAAGHRTSRGPVTRIAGRTIGREAELSQRLKTAFPDQLPIT